MPPISAEGPATVRTVDDDEPPVIVPDKLFGRISLVTRLAPRHAGEYHGPTHKGLAMMQYGFTYPSSTEGRLP